MQPTVSIARLPSASSKPEASASEPLGPQPVAASRRLVVLEVGPNAGKSEAAPLEREEPELETE
jgi:hypothetical protein